MTETRTAVIAIGGNALSPPGERSSIGDQFRHTRESLGPIVDLALDGWRVVVVHGNGPQVGDELVRNEKARSEVAPLPLGVLVAGTAGWIGYMLQQSLENALRKSGSARDVVTVLTQVEVAADDPALKDPKKFIGHGISMARARELRGQGHPVKKDAKGHFRRVVGSPKPLAIHELSTIKVLLEQNTVVIACGGGGIPIYRDPTLGLEGVDAVVDKDLAAAVLARELGAELFMILTDVDAVYTGWGTDAQHAISSMTVSEAERLAREGAFGEGSMGPKVAAATDYVRRTGGRAIITELSKGRAAVQGEGGTEILP
ncbi:MAG: carbamate kinase [Gemmatimonadaceae bacterium]|jgi:carbamate kinase